MEDVSCTGEGAGTGESGALPDAAINLAEMGKIREASTSGIEEASAFAAPLPTPSRSAYHSARIERMIASRSEFESEVEFQTAHSRVHWSEFSRGAAPGSGESESSSGGSGWDSSGPSESGSGPLAVDHREFFHQLQKDAYWGNFCSKVVNVVLGRKLGEGAEGVIYEAQVTFVPEEEKRFAPFEGRIGFVVKVMKAAHTLEDLHRLWPRGVASLQDLSRVPGVGSMMFPLYGALVKDHATQANKFGFVMRRYWGDLRTLIDQRMIRKGGQGPPFTDWEARRIINIIAFEMANLHMRGILHRDLKASNVLITQSPGLEDRDLLCPAEDEESVIFPYVADWECSLGVVGTRFWKAPEILLQLKNKNPSNEVVFDEAADVYSFGMTCYEIVTGLLPFEGLPFSETRDAILDGVRLELPSSVEDVMRFIISACWEHDPSRRPSFVGIVRHLDWFCFNKWCNQFL